MLKSVGETGNKIIFNDYDKANVDFIVTICACRMTVTVNQ